MTNNDVLRRLRYTFDLNDKTMINIFSQAELTVSREQVSNWLKKDDDADYTNCSDVQLATFLNGFINDRRGKKEGEQPKPEKKLTNNIVFRKLKIALDLRDEDILEILLLADLRISKHELSAFFRRADHKHFRQCKDQILRNFLHGVQIMYGPEEEEE
ncbi:MAG: DUF1456 family protein [Piscirickettsiaceae bacterium]|nr:DUF1456 family protein [Piscirickettsiaceae bacterium]